jgi:hypothetical protein
MSEYLITTKTIAGAQDSDMVARQGAASLWWLAVVIAAAALVLGGAA